MKKIFLVLTLLVSGFGFTDLEMTLLDCERMRDDLPRMLFDKKLNVRLDESKKKLRVNLMPATFYDDRNQRRYLIAYQDYEKLTYEIRVYRDNLHVSFGYKPIDEKKSFERRIYACRII